MTKINYKPQLKDTDRERTKFLFGRVHQSLQFMENLKLPVGDSQRKSLFNIFGPSGVGKTWYLNELQQITREQKKASVRMDRNTPTVLGCLNEAALQLEKQGWPFRGFRERYHSYLRLRNELKSRLEGSSAGQSFINNLVRNSIDDMFHDKFAGEKLELSDREGAIKEAEEPGAIVLGRALEAKDQFLIQHPVEALTQAFLADLSEWDGKNSVVWFVDDYESIGEALDSWLLSLLDGEYGELPTGLVFVIAGRDRLSSEGWKDIQEDMCIPLESFSPDEVEALLHQFKITDPRVISTIAQLTEGLPAWVDILANQVPKKAEKIGDGYGTAMERLLQWIEDPLPRRIVVEASIPRFVNQDILGVIVEPKFANRLLVWLIKKAVVRQSAGNQWFYHELVRNQLLNYLRSHSEQSWVDLHQKMADYYQSKRVDIEAPFNSASDQSCYVIYTQEMIYHRFCSNPTGERADALNDIVSAMGMDDKFGLRCALALSQAERDCEIGEAERWGMILVEGIQAHYEIENLTKIEDMVHRLLTSQYLSADSHKIIDQWYQEISVLFYDFDQRIAEINRAIELDPQDGAAYFKRGAIHYSAGRFEDAIADQTRAIERDSNVALYHEQRGVSYHALGDYEKSIADISQAIAFDPDNARYFFNRGMSYYCIEEYKKGILDLQRAIDLDPQNALYYQQRSVFHQKLGAYKEEIADLTRAIALVPENAWLYFHRGVSYFKLERDEKSIDDLSRAIEIAPPNADFYFNRAIVYHRMGYYQQTISDINHAIELDPKNASYFKQRGLSYYEAELYEEAIADATRAVELDPLNAELYYDRGSSYFMTEYYDEAINDFTRAIELDPDNAFYYQQRSVSHFAVGNVSEDLADISRAIKLDPNNAEYYYERGESYYKYHRYKSAAADINRAIRLSPNIAKYYELRAKIFEGLDEYDKADRDRFRAIQISKRERPL